jgi:hypothetical protein
VGIHGGNMAQVIKRGMFQSFDNTTYTASVLILEATSTFLVNVPVATYCDGASAQTQGYCAVLFFDEHNVNDAVVIAIYPNSTQGVPTPPPGRTTFVAGFQQLNSVAINAGVTQSYTLTGVGGIPASGVLGVLYKLYFFSANAGAFVQMAPQGGTIANYASFGNTTVANETINGNGVIGVSSAGQVDIKANSQNVTVTLFTYGYVI